MLFLCDFGILFSVLNGSTLVCLENRAEYNPDQYLWEKNFTLAGRKYKREDLEASMGFNYWSWSFFRAYVTFLLFGWFHGVLSLWIILHLNVQLRNERGHTLQCSHYVPSHFPDGNSLPCVIYCHGNRFGLFFLKLLLLQYTSTTLPSIY